MGKGDVLGASQDSLQLQIKFAENWLGRIKLTCRFKQVNDSAFKPEKTASEDHRHSRDYATAASRLWMAQTPWSVWNMTQWSIYPTVRRRLGERYLVIGAVGTNSLASETSNIRQDPWYPDPQKQKPIVESVVNSSMPPRRKNPFTRYNQDPSDKRIVGTRANGGWCKNQGQVTLSTSCRPPCDTPQLWIG